MRDASSDEVTVPYACAVPTCERCGRENPDEARFCNGCGAQLTPTAPRDRRGAQGRHGPVRRHHGLHGAGRAARRRAAERGASARSSRRCARRSKPRAGRSRSSSATPSWRHSECRGCTRTTRRARCAPRCACAGGSADLNEELGERYGVALELRDRHQHRRGDGRHRPAPRRGARDRRCGQRRRAHRAGGRAGPDSRRRAHGAGRPPLPLRRRRTCSRCAVAASPSAPSSCSPISPSPRARCRAHAPRSSAGGASSSC